MDSSEEDGTEGHTSKLDQDILSPTLKEMTLTGFLFGNIDQKGNLEDDILDPVSSSSPLVPFCWDHRTPIILVNQGTESLTGGRLTRVISWTRLVASSPLPHLDGIIRL